MRWASSISDEARLDAAMAECSDALDASAPADANSALMQGLGDGYFVIPYTIGDYLATQKPGSRPSADGAEFKAAEAGIVAMTQRFLDETGRPCVMKPFTFDELTRVVLAQAVR